MKNWFKKIFIQPGEKTTVVAYNSWVVRWVALKSDWEYGQSGGKPQAEIFPSEEDAYKFAEQLKEAHKLLRYEGHKLTKVEVEANQSKMSTMVQ